MYKYFNPNEIKPTGWLKRQLEIQAEGLSGNLDKIWPDIKDSAWIGGTSEGWERVPYWLDGFIPLAYILDDKDMIFRADLYINAILNRQQKDGWICPCKQEEREHFDIWALFLICKVLVVYYEFTHSKKAEESIYRASKNALDLLESGKIKLFNWGKARWYEAFISLNFLAERYQEEWIIRLAETLKTQGTDFPELAEFWKIPLNKWTYETHVVNLCMMIKYEVMAHSVLGGKYENKAEELWKLLYRYNGTAVGTLTGDECLSGISAIQGTELCSVVELMYSFELMYAYTGNPIWADRLEKIAFNALPATLSDDMWTHQYDQMVNQIACQTFPGKSIFRTNGEQAHLFGLEPHYGCCTSNFSQGWPKLAMNVFLKTNRGILCSMMLPSELQTTIGDTRVNINIQTEYPFRHLGRYTVSTSGPVNFELQIRIPGWAKDVKVNGETVSSKKTIRIEKKWDGIESITVEFTDQPKLVNRPYGLKTLEYGAFVFALPVKAEYKMHEYESNNVVRKFPYCDYELIPQSAWNYGFDGNSFEVEEKEGDNIPFSSKNPRVVIKAHMAKIDWGYEDGYEAVAAKTPKSRKKLAAAESIELYPYGCAKLRMTEMPKLKS